MPTRSCWGRGDGFKKSWFLFSKPPPSTELEEPWHLHLAKLPWVLFSPGAMGGVPGQKLSELLNRCFEQRQPNPWARSVTSGGPPERWPQATLEARVGKCEEVGTTPPTTACWPWGVRSPHTPRPPAPVLQKNPVQALPARPLRPSCVSL